MTTVVRNHPRGLATNCGTHVQQTRNPPARSSGISARPQRGSAYVPYSHSSSDWEKARAPGGRRLWCRMVVAFAFIAVLGFTFILLGALFVRQAYGIYQTHRLSLPLVWCIIGIVTGSLMFLGSFVLGRLIISSKWRRNEERDYSRPGNNGAVRYRPRTPQHQVSPRDADLPPPYEASQPPSVFFITRGSEPIPGQTSEFIQPPSYSELPLQEPPKYTPFSEEANSGQPSDDGAVSP